MEEVVVLRGGEAQAGVNRRQCGGWVEDESMEEGLERSGCGALRQWPSPLHFQLSPLLSCPPHIPQLLFPLPPPLPSPLPPLHSHLK